MEHELRGNARLFGFASWLRFTARLGGRGDWGDAGGSSDDALDCDRFRLGAGEL